MTTKAYFANTVEAAVQRASQELGDEALLLGARPAPPESAKLGRYEVTFGIPGDPPTVPGATAADCHSLSRTGPVTGSVQDDLRQIRFEMEEIRARLLRPGIAPATAKFGQPYSWMFTRLLDTGVDEQLATELVQAAQQRTSRQPRRSSLSEETADAQRALVAEMEGRIKVCPRLGRPGTARAVVALVGPAGAGKTSAVLKLAILRGTAKRRKVRLISLDGGRIGGGQLLGSYAALLDAPHQVLDNAAALPAAIAQDPTANLILIDTSGFGSHESDAMEDMAKVLLAQKADTHLVLPANLAERDMRRIADSYSSFRPSALLFTRLDETDSPAGAYMEAIRQQVPLSFLSAGPEVHDHLEEAKAITIVERILFRVAEAAASAA